MDQYNRDIIRLKNIPVLQGDTNLAITTRGISEIIQSENILATLKIMYCHHVTSTAFRLLANTLINNIEKDIQKTVISKQN